MSHCDETHYNMFDVMRHHHNGDIIYFPLYLSSMDILCDYHIVANIGVIVLVLLEEEEKVLLLVLVEKVKERLVLV